MKSVIVFLLSSLTASSSFALTTLTCTTQLKTSTVGVSELRILEEQAPQLSSLSAGALLNTKVLQSSSSTSYRVLNINTSKLPQGLWLVMAGNIANRDINQGMKVKVYLHALSPQTIKVAMVDAVSKQTYSVNLDTLSDDGATMTLENQSGVKFEMTCHMR